MEKKKEILEQFINCWIMPEIIKSNYIFQPFLQRWENCLGWLPLLQCHY